MGAWRTVSSMIMLMLFAFFISIVVVLLLLWVTVGLADLFDFGHDVL